MVLRQSGVRVELREVVLKNKPSAMLELSAKGTVPVLQLPDGTVIDESRGIMEWALALSDPDSWAPDTADDWAEVNELLDENDGSFKHHLDCYKYPERYPREKGRDHRRLGARFLGKLESRLTNSNYLLGERPSIADVAIFPFIRQFAHTDKAWFYQADYPNLQRWLEGFLTSELFTAVMHKYAPWQAGDEPIYFPLIQDRTDCE